MQVIYPLIGWRQRISTSTSSLPYNRIALSVSRKDENQKTQQRNSRRAKNKRRKPKTKSKRSSRIQAPNAPSNSPVTDCTTFTFASESSHSQCHLARSLSFRRYVSKPYNYGSLCAAIYWRSFLLSQICFAVAELAPIVKIFGSECDLVSKSGSDFPNCLLSLSFSVDFARLI